MWVATALVLAACGGDASENGATSVDDRASDASSEGAAGVDVTIAGDEAGAGNVRPAGGAADIGLEPLERRGNLTITVTSPRVSSRIDGACDGSNSQVQFMSDDGLTKFIVFTGDATGGAGEITADVEGEQLTWVAAAESETSAAQTDRTSAYYEGDFIQGDDIAFAVVQIACSE